MELIEVFLIIIVTSYVIFLAILNKVLSLLSSMILLSTNHFSAPLAPNPRGVAESSRAAQQKKPHLSARFEPTPLDTPSRKNQDHVAPGPQQPGSSQSVPEQWPLQESTEAFLSEVGNAEWRKFEPPPELTFRQTEADQEIRSIFQSSIERIRRGYLDEVHAAEAAALAAGIAAIEGVESSSLSNSQSDNYLSPHGPRYRGSSSSSGTSHDSGYGSISSSSDTESPKLFKISSFFKRRGKEAIRESSKSLTEVTAPPTRLAPPPPGQEPEASISQPLELECVSCLDDFPTGEMIKLVCHSYCKPCFSRLIATAMDSETHWPAKCCLNTIPAEVILPHLDNKFKKKYAERDEEWSIPVGERIYCSHQTCSAFIAPKHVRIASHSAKCPSCSRKTCSICRGAYHEGSDCPRDPSLLATDSLAELEGWMRCFSCHSYVEHNQGCRHMTCRCKAQFCYICGVKWRTCECTETQLVAKLARVNAHRQERLATERRQAQEEEEIRRALQEIEEMERREAERLAREAEAERRAAEAARRRREEQRIAGISRKFRRFTSQLATLHDAQRVLIAERHEHEVQVLQKEREDTTITLQLRQSTEEQLLGIESQTAISDVVYLFDKEYQEKRAKERQIEEDYLNQLRTFWEGKPQGELKIYKALGELRKDLDKQFREWVSIRQRQVEVIASRETKKLKGLKSRQESELLDIQKSHEKGAHEWRIKKWAEEMWIEGVVRERANMLLSMEQEEYARGE
ncbi:hypothetical protein F5884DRAFT_719267 [Xylogone sp. PMI_703]|nr:hypothetical protein F5884DRAFT_719267 [Xylogone sp. PMI_703]